MATLFDMYKDVATPDVFYQTRAARQESEANTKKTMDTSFGMLKKSNIGTLQQEYRAGTGRFEGIADPDKKFQVYYDALKALDPQAAQDAAKVYGEERQRRINKEIADAYEREGSTGNPELDAIDKAIADLESSIAVEEAQIAQEKQVEQQYAAGIQAKQDELALNPSIDTGRLNQPIDTELYANGEPQSDVSKLGTVPEQPTQNSFDLRRMYGLNPDFDISLSRGASQPAEELTKKSVDIRSQQTPNSGMEDYLPMSRYTNYKPETRRLANMYRGI